jgi:hypothetical protein
VQLVLSQAKLPVFHEHAVEFKKVHATALEQVEHVLPLHASTHIPSPQILPTPHGEVPQAHSVDTVVPAVQFDRHLFSIQTLPDAHDTLPQAQARVRVVPILQGSLHAYVLEVFVHTLPGLHHSEGLLAL